MHNSNFRLFGKHCLHTDEIVTPRKFYTNNACTFLINVYLFIFFLLNGFSKWLYKIY